MRGARGTSNSIDPVSQHVKDLGSFCLCTHRPQCQPHPEDCVCETAVSSSHGYCGARFAEKGRERGPLRPSRHSEQPSLPRRQPPHSAWGSARPRQHASPGKRCRSCGSTHSATSSAKRRNLAKLTGDVDSGNTLPSRRYQRD